MVALILTFLLTAMTYLDRICVFAAASFIMGDLGLTVLQMRNRSTARRPWPSPTVSGGQRRRLKMPNRRNRVVVV